MKKQAPCSSGEVGQRACPHVPIYMRNIPTRHATKSPTITGIKFRLTRSTGLTPETPESAATPKAQAAIVPPPTKIPATWPKDAKMATFKPGADPTAADKAPVKGKPENPEPSNPPRIPTKAIPNDVINGLSPKLVAIICPQSNKNPGVSSPNMATASSGFPKKKKPAMGITGAKILMAK